MIHRTRPLLLRRAIDAQGQARVGIDLFWIGVVIVTRIIAEQRARDRLLRDRRETGRGVVGLPHRRRSSH